MRKDLLASSLKAVKDGKQSPQPVPDAPRKMSGVRAVQKGLDHLASGAARAIATDQIADSAVQDRFDVSDGIDDLVESIRASGQKLPVLLRRRPEAVRPYEVVYGRRRIEACRRLDIDVQAYVVDMDDREALISQGLENAARLQRSYIEQAVYAEQLLDHAFTREEIMEVLAVDKTTISRMLGVVTGIPRQVINAIGPAHDAGRRPWLQLRDVFQQDPGLTTDRVLPLVDGSLPSGERLPALLRQLTAKPTPAPRPAPVKRDVADGRLRLERHADRVSVWVRDDALSGFSEFLDSRMDQLLSEFHNARSGD
ncbi:plasmid partitioning protein RepB [Chachezhania sediminis]|uniref:plasmid partitioning protein RepB n=1 Tax=Chachezhania sediminis TaxID=2599291 RepID=UPI00131A61B5|nr:plasmid partitioning protein RepB [Chachezhania sediminis]